MKQKRMEWMGSFINIGRIITNNIQVLYNYNVGIAALGQMVIGDIWSSAVQSIASLSNKEIQ